ncbi:MAG TPA: M13 family metallopeptidase [Aliidiomarina sp.]|nr:M13 family metallopeptidase [Aliidiomarina sp.]
MKRTSLLAFSVAAALGLTACSPAQNTQPSTDFVNEIKHTTTISGVELENLNTAVNPADDFFQYINGQWLERTQIPADRARWGSFDELRERAEEQVLAIINELSAIGGEKGSNAQKIGDLFNAYLDVERINSLGLAPIQGYFDTIDALKSHADLAAFWGQQQRTRMGTPVSMFVGQDQMQSDQYITTLSQSGLGMPDRDYYVNDSAENIALREAYGSFIDNLWSLAGWENGEQAATTVLAIETKLANAHWSRIQNRDRRATYNKMSLAELAEQAPGFAWSDFFEQAGVDINDVVVRQPDYMKTFADMYKNVSLADWKTYFKFHTLRASAGYLPTEFGDASFEFYGRTLQGLEEQRSREKQAVAMVESALGFLIGQEYVARHYKEESRARMEELVANIKVAFGEAIDDLEWMTPATKLEAQAKLATFTTKIGYPEKWRDYDCLDIVANDLMANVTRAGACEYQRMVDRLGSEVDQYDWGMTPQTVNAYYRSTMNEIVFPAAILQPPFFNVDADDAVNYGAIGAVIGHEITHGFDDQGRRSDGAGNLRDWWSEQDEEQFSGRAKLMIDQYSSFNPIDDLYLRGALGLGENIADLGGLTVAYRAYQNSLHGQTAKVIDGFTAEQRFFAGWGQIWRIKFRDESLRRQVIQGPHSPGKYRVLGVLSNMPEFYQAYEVKPGDGMYREPEVRVKIW